MRYSLWFIPDKSNLILILHLDKMDAHLITHQLKHQCSILKHIFLNKDNLQSTFRTYIHDYVCQTPPHVCSLSITIFGQYVKVEKYKY